MDEKDKSFEKNFTNNLNQQRDEVVAGAQIERTMEQRNTEHNERAAQNRAEHDAELVAGAGIEATMEGRVAEGLPEEARKDQMAIPGQGTNQAGRHGGLTEEQAKALLAEETRKTEKKLEKAHKSNRKLAVVAIIVAVVLCVAGVAFALIMANRQEDDKASDKGNADAPVVDGGEQEPEPEEPEDEVVVLNVNDPLVQRLYGNFFAIDEFFDGWWGFYVDNGVKNGKIPSEKMLLLAGANFRNGVCVGDYEYGNGGKVENDCSAGEDVRKKIAEMFAVDVELSDGDKIGDFCGGKVYVAANDEFHQVGNGCGGASSTRMTRVLESAEQQGDNIYLFEKVLIFDAQEYYQVGTSEVKGEKIGEYSVPVDVQRDGDEYSKWLAKNEIDLTDRYGAEFKWIFTKNDSGEYIFTGLERVQ